MWKMQKILLRDLESWNLLYVVFSENEFIRYYGRYDICLCTCHMLQLSFCIKEFENVSPIFWNIKLTSVTVIALEKLLQKHSISLVICDWLTQTDLDPWAYKQPNKLEKLTVNDMYFGSVLWNVEQKGNTTFSSITLTIFVNRARNINAVNNTIEWNTRMIALNIYVCTCLVIIKWIVSLESA